MKDILNEERRRDHIKKRGRRPNSERIQKKQRERDKEKANEWKERDSLSVKKKWKGKAKQWKKGKKWKKERHIKWRRKKKQFKCEESERPNSEKDEIKRVKENSIEWRNKDSVHVKKKQIEKEGKTMKE